jgi:polysaccharide biosynthesis protein PslG
MSRRFRVISLVLLVALAVTAVLAARPSLGEREQPIPSGLPLDNAASSAIPNTDVNPFGANFFLEWEPEAWKIEKSYQMAREAGIGWVKQQFPWEDLQLTPGPNGFWDERLNKSTWEKYDRIVDLALKHNLQVIARLDRPPRWARQDNSISQAPPDRYEDFGDFVAAVVEHYKGRIYHYQIWNEPNVYPEWGSRPPDPAAYVRLLSIANRRAKEVDPNVWILSAPLAQTLEHSNRNLSDVEYLEGMYASGARPYFDILFANAYGFAFPPEDEPNRERLNFARVVLLREVMEANGDSQKAVWFNEFGWNAAPDDFPPTKLPWARVSEQLQADYTVRAIQMARAKWPWTGVFNIWYFRQSGHVPSDSADYYFRMVDTGFAPRPVYTAVKASAESVGVAKPGTYEETNPAAVFAGHWLATRDDAASGGAYSSTSASGDSLTIGFKGRAFDVLVRGGPGNGPLVVTVDGRESNVLPRDRQGRSYIELSALTQGASQWVRVADRLTGDSHVVRFVSSPAARPDASAPTGIDGFRVVDEGGLDVAAYWPAAIAVALVVIVGLGLRRRRSDRG